ncbi:MAG TPA: alpha/beta hydrolase [Gemmatimonadales bacterium]|nr:alpha/beta hydrolase [Gemmatimonadales bacterium]
MLFSLLALTAFHAGAIDSSDRVMTLAPDESLHVTIDGPVDGPPVVIVPGIVSPAYAFRHVLPPLAAAGVRAVVIEPLGFGGSSRPGDADYSHTRQAERVAAVMDSLHISHAVVMGQAVGAPITLRLALARPDLISRLLIVEEGAIESPAVPGVQTALKFAFFIRLFAGRGRLRKELRKGLVASSGDTSWVTDQVVDAYTEGAAGDVGAVLRGLKGMQNSVEPDSLTPRLNEIQIPVRLLVGGAPHKSGMAPARIRDLEERVPHFSMETVPGAGLHIQEEQPGVIVSELLKLVHDEAEANEPQPDRADRQDS